MLPLEFQNRIKTLLGAEAELLLAELERPESVHALRVNPQKISVERFLSLFPGECSPIPYASDGFYFRPGEAGTPEKLGNTPYHHAGMIYLQDPAAMSALHALPIQHGWRVLDACAAPGGKSSQLSAYVGNGGLVVSNEYVSARARVLAGNLERLGCRNAVVINVDTAVLKEWYPSSFDLVVADVPCSGEGMFRKNTAAISEWSEENVLLCTARQKVILKNLVDCVRPGGYLLYSTCTFAPEENEQNVAWLLEQYPEFSLCPVSELLSRCTADGIALPGISADLTLTRRFYPHRCPGEGQFIALLRRKGDKKESTVIPCFRENARDLTSAEKSVLECFLRTTVSGELSLRLVVYRDKVLGLPEGMQIPPFGVIAAGVALGRLVKGRFEPEHHLFSAFGDRFQRRLELSASDPRVAEYLHGDVIRAEGLSDGWATVLVEGCPLGGVKVVGGLAKNHYPKGLRIP